MSATAAEPRRLRTFRLNVGLHIENGPDGKERVYRAGRPHLNEPETVFQTYSDLNTLNGRPPMYPKFTELGVGVGYLPGEANPSTQAPPPPSPPTPSGLEGMTLEDLKALAVENEIDTKGAKSQADYVKAIRNAMGTK